MIAIEPATLGRLLGLVVHDLRNPTATISANVAFIRGAAFWYCLAPPWPRPAHQFPWLGYDPRGMSLFLASPAFVYAIVGIRRAWSNAAVRHATAACAVCLVPLLLYFNTGYWQFGHRFSMDYLPMLMVLVLAGTGSRPSRLAWALAGLSVGVGALLRCYVLHCVGLPLAAATLMAIHFWRVRKDGGISGPL